MTTKFATTSLDRALEQRETELARTYHDADVQVALAVLFAPERATSDLYWATLHFA